MSANIWTSAGLVWLGGSLSGALLPADDWPLFRGGPELTGVATSPLSDSLELLWTFEAGSAIASSPVVADGRVFVGCDDANVYALDFASGAKLWSFATDDIVESPPLVVEGRVFVGSHDGFLYALDAKTGERLWRGETGDKLVGGANLIPAGADTPARVVVGSYDSSVYCFDATSGAQVWRYATENYVNGTPAVVGGRVVFGGCDAGLHVVSATTGEQLSKLELGPNAHVAGSVGTRDGQVYVGHYGEAFVGYDLERDEHLWEYRGREAFFSSPAITAERVVFGGRDKRLHCVDRASGESVWTFRTRRKVDGSPLVSGERVVFGTSDGRVYLLDLASGAEVWSYEVGSAILASPAIAHGKLLVAATDGRVYAFGPAAAVADPEETEQ